MADYGESLSQRELDVLRELVGGASNKEIGNNLSISANTVKVHLRNLFTKLGASSRTEAVVIAMKWGILDGGEVPLSIELLEEIVEKETESVQESEEIEFDQGKEFIAQEEFLPEEEIDPIVAANSSAESFTPTSAIIEPTHNYSIPMLKTAPVVISSRPRTNQWKLLAVGLGGIVMILTAFLMWDWRNGIDGKSMTTTPFVTERWGDTGWSTTFPSTRPSAGFALVAIGPTLYQLSGEVGGKISAESFTYQPSKNLWQPITSKPTAVTDAGAAVLVGQIFMPGGRLKDGLPTASLEVYSPTNNAWRSASALPHPIAGATTLAYGEQLYLFGGWDGTHYLNTAYLYDPSSDNWRPLPPMQHARSHAAGGVIGQSLYVVGGYDGNADLPFCEQFDPNTESWQACPPLLVPRGGAVAVSLLNKLYLVGGGIKQPTPYGELYEPSKQAWQVLNVPLFAKPVRWTGFGMAAVETHIFVMGGRVNDEAQSKNYDYNSLPYQFFLPAAPH